MKRIIGLIYLVTFGASYQARSNTNSRSDTVDVLNYSIHLDITDFVGNSIKGYCEIKFTPKINSVGHIHLDLLELMVDSVKMNDTQLSYTYNDTLLKANFSSFMSIGDTGI